MRGKALLELTKPRITQLVVLTAAAGFYLASRGRVNPMLLAHTLLGTALVAGGTNALNQVWERERDALMDRTRRRPLPSGRVTARAGAVFGVSIAMSGVAYLWLAVNAVTAVLATGTLVSYVFVYTPLKRRTPLNTLVGAVPGALPIVGGWTAAGGTLDVAALALFGIVFLWQLPHFLALAWIYRDDYARAGFRMFGARDQDAGAMGRRAAGFAAFLVPVSLAPALLGMAGPMYSWGAVAIGVGFLGTAVAFAIMGTSLWARRLFAASVLYLPVLLVMLVVGRGPV